jgi:hypothetical protein
VDAGGVGSIDQTGLYCAGDIEGTATVQVQADGLTATADVLVQDGGPTIEYISGGPNPDYGTTANLCVYATDPAGQASLSYSWSLLGEVPAPVTFSDNNDYTADNTIATFSMAGTYTIMVTATDPSGLSASAGGTIQVEQSVTTLLISPPEATVAPLGTVSFVPTPLDQFGYTMSLQGIGTVTWSVASGVGTVNNAGAYTAPASGGPATVQAYAAGESVTGVAYINSFATPVVATCK